VVGLKDDGSARDLIGDYLEQLRRGLRFAPGRAEEILAEAEDHLRETAAAGLAIGMTEREAAEAAISSFGPVAAVTRAHLARANGGMAVLATAAWKLVSLLLLAGGIGGMAAIVVSGLGLPAARQRWALLGDPHAIASDHLSFNLVSGVWTDTVRYNGPGFIVGWLWQQSFLGWHAAVLMAAAGAVLLVGYGLTRRRVPGLPLPGFFPALAVSVFGAVGLAFLVFWIRTGTGTYDTRPLVAVCLALALGYAVRLGQARLRQR
jgi:hypothetical protein